jgi:hypothetical protein
LSKSSMMQCYSSVSNTLSVIAYIDRIKNTEINGLALDRLKMLVQRLIDTCNLRLLVDFPTAIEDRPIDEIEFEITSSYFQGLKFSEIEAFVIDSLQQAETLFDETRCIDALQVLLSYCNFVVFSRFDRGLELRERRLNDIYTTT